MQMFTKDALGQHTTNQIAKSLLHFHRKEEVILMITTETWWEEIFSGPLSIGLNEQKMSQLEDESFLYLNEQAATQLTDEQPM